MEWSNSVNGNSSAAISYVKAIYVDRNYRFGQKKPKTSGFDSFYMLFGIFEDFSKAKICKFTMPFSLLILAFFEKNKV